MTTTATETQVPAGLSEGANDTVQMLVEFIADMKLAPVLDAYIRGRDRDGGGWQDRYEHLYKEIY